MAEAKYTDEQRRKFAEATGLEPDKVTDDILAKAGVETEPAKPVVSDEDARKLADALGVEGDTVDPAKLLEAAKAKTTAKPEQKTVEQEEIVRRLEVAETDAKDAKDQLRVEKRRSFVESILKDGKAKPGQRERIEKMFDRDEDNARAYFADAPIDLDLVREYGSDEEGRESGEPEAELAKAFEADLASRTGVKVEELI